MLTSTLRKLEIHMVKTESRSLSLTLYANHIKVHQRQIRPETYTETQIRPETLKFLEGRIKETLEVTGTFKEFLNRMAIAQEIMSRVKNVTNIKF